MADVARLAGVSPMTVSRAFKRDTSVSEATREAILKAAEEIGFPVFVKAVSGGGGRGMRLVPDAERLPAALAEAMRR